MKGAVASGHPLTAGAAAKMISLGGNAFDAAVSAGFASVVAEPALTSLGGGGFLLAHIEKQQKDVLFDFFVNTPGLGDKENLKPLMTPVDIKFPECTQVFHTGFGSVAVPGMLKGLLHIHKRLCTLPLETILVPALSYLEEGVEICEIQGVFLGLLEPIFTSSKYGKEIYMKNGDYIKQGDKLYNPQLKTFFEGIANNNHDLYSGEIAQRLIDEMKNQNGLITQSDLNAYEVIERNPLRIKYRDREILTNPPPSLGGIKLALGLRLLEDVDLASIHNNSEEFLIKLLELMKEIYYFKPLSNGSPVMYPFSDSVTSRLIKSYTENISGKTFTATRGTTHISVIDEAGNAASMTTSNGSGSGCFAPETGIMLNNMMGEDDLHPEGFFSSPPNRRVASMMLPTMVMKDGRVEYVLGSGGSKRIRTAILQVLINIIDFNYPLNKAVETCRVHFEDGIAQVEPEVPVDIINKLKRHYRINRWNKKNMYFGGVHCVNRDMEGWGDSRRGGVFMASS